MSEISLFADSFNSLVGTTENLAMGKYARNLQQSISKQVLEDIGVEIEVSDSQGIGGREKDGMGTAMDEQVEENNTYEDSILDYYGNQKLNSNRSNRAGIEFYPTPEPVGWKMVEWAGIVEGDEVLEPSAGQGAIARYVPRTNKLTAIEPSMFLMNTLKLRAGGLGRSFIDDIFENHSVKNKYEVILMNPPFENKGKLAQAHIKKALEYHLQESGRCIAIMPNGSSMNTWEENFLEDTPYIVKTAEILLPTCAFERAGTKVATKIVIYDKIANVIDYLTIAKMKEWYNYTEQRVDLRECKDVKELFEKLKEVEVQKRKIPLFLKRYNQAKKTLNDFKTLPIVLKTRNSQNKMEPEVIFDRIGLLVRCKTIGYYTPERFLLRFKATSYEYGFQYDRLKYLIEHIPESLKNEAIYKIKDNSGQTTEVNAKDVIEEYYKLCMTTIENVSGKTPRELLELAYIYMIIVKIKTNY